ncbi:MAG: methyltransferase domain-containing protein [Candidatus Paceibacterota bacterium]|jgi:hypothetical protein
MSSVLENNQNEYSVEQFVEKFGFEKCIFDLLKFIEKDNNEIKNIIIAKYLKEKISAESETKLLEYFINNSVFSAATFANPATSVVTEFLYTRPNVSHPIDEYFFASRGGSAIHSRIVNVEENLHSLIEEYLKKDKVLIGNLGGGPGRDIIDVFSKYYKDNNNVFCVNVDRDKNTILRGKRIATMAGVIDKIDFSETSFMRHKPKKKFDIIILVGVLCGLPSETCVLILKLIKKMLAKGGCIIASNVTPKMLEEDPFTYFIMEKITNWHLVFKEEELLKDIFKKAGLKWQKSFSDDYRYHNMGIGTIK